MIMILTMQISNGNNILIEMIIAIMLMVMKPLIIDIPAAVGSR